MAGEIPKSTDPDLLLIQNLKRQQKQLKKEQQRQQNQQNAPQSSQFYASIPQIHPTVAQPQIPIPAGRIVDDSARGILFWEASTCDAVQDSQAPSHTSSMTSETENSTNNCPDCNGFGKVRIDCDECNGTGKVTKTRIVRK